MATGVALGLLAAVFWGVADFFIRGATQAAGTFRTLYFEQFIGLLVFVVAIEPWSPLSFARATPALSLAAIGLNLVILIGVALLYRSFTIGALSVVSPIAASFGAITTALAILVSHERPSAAQLVGIVVTLAGVGLTGMHTGGAPTPEAPQKWGLKLGKGVPEVLLATAIFGVTYWALRYITPVLGGAQVAMIGKITDLTALTLLVAGAWLWRKAGWMPALTSGWAPVASAPLAPRGTRFWVWIIPAAILDVSANIFYNIGITTTLTSIVVTLSSLFTAFTVLLAWIFLRERLSGWQWVGVALILVGIVLVNV
jgi:drug/metabolite transporter (DMT)-like permease